MKITAQRSAPPIHDPANKDGIFLRPPGSVPTKLGPVYHKLPDDLRMELRSGMWCFFGSGLPAYSFRVDCDKSTAGAILRDLRSHAALVAALTKAEQELSFSHVHFLSLYSRDKDRSGTTAALCDSTLGAAEQARAALNAAKS